MTLNVTRLSAFPYQGAGGNPAGVVLEAMDVDESDMQKTAAEVGYSETIFVTGRSGSRLRVRYFSPEMEVDFCGHATIAAGVALGETSGLGSYIFETNTGDVEVRVSEGETGFIAELASKRAIVTEIGDEGIQNLLHILLWNRSALSQAHTALVVDTGNAHPVLVLNSPETLATLDYAFEELKTLCRANNWVTLQIVVQESEGVWQSRNPFAFGGVYEDPATGSAAAAFGVYLRETGKIEPGESLLIKQGFAMGRPSLIKVKVGADECIVSGTAVQIGPQGTDQHR